MPLMLDPDQIADSRPADSVFYTEWWIDPEDRPEDRPRRKEMVAVEFSLFKVLRYEEHVYETFRETRQKIEEWHIPAVRIPAILAPMTITVSPPDTTVTAQDAHIVIYDIPKSTVARSTDEYRYRERRVF